MHESTTMIESQAMALPLNERAELVSRLLASLEARDDATPADVEKAWLDEASRRYEALTRGDEPGLTHEEVFSDLRSDSH